MYVYEGHELSPWSVQQNTVHPSQHSAPGSQSEHVMTLIASTGFTRYFTGATASAVAARAMRDRKLRRDVRRSMNELAASTRRLVGVPMPLPVPGPGRSPPVIRRSPQLGDTTRRAWEGAPS